MTASIRRPGRLRRSVFATLAGWAILGAAATGITACTSASAGTAAVSSASGAAAGTADAATSTGTASTDGTYTATGDYSTPGGSERISVTVTLEDGVITAVTAEGDASRPPSSQYQNAFESAVADEVVGVSIDEVDLDTVAGSSLTPDGFMAALEQIQADAAA